MPGSSATCWYTFSWLCGGLSSPLPDCPLWVFHRKNLIRIITISDIVRNENSLFDLLGSRWSKTKSVAKSYHLLKRLWHHKAKVKWLQNKHKSKEEPTARMDILSLNGKLCSGNRKEKVPKSHIKLFKSAKCTCGRRQNPITSMPNTVNWIFWQVFNEFNSRFANSQFGVPTRI